MTLSRLLRASAGTFALTLALLAGGCASDAAPVAAPAAVAPPIAPPKAYTRFRRMGDDAYAVRMCIREFRPVSGQGPAVYLAGAIHIGDPAYYQALQKHLDAQEVVLFEGVRPENPEAVRKNAEKRKEGADTYSRLARALGLVSQGAGIDYRRKHFRNADLSIEAVRGNLAEAAKQPGAAGDDARAAVAQFAMLENVLMGDNPLLAIGLWALENNRHARAQFRFMLASGSGRMEEGNNPALSSRLMETILRERNDAALEELAKVLRETPQVRSISIFYGAAHLRDMEEKLVKRFGYRPVRSEWLSAVTVHPLAEGLSEDEVKAMTGE